MNRIHLLILFCLIASFTAKAQKTDFESRLFVGAGAGVLLPSIDFVPTVFQETGWGIHGGISAKYLSQKHLGMILEVNFAQRGWKQEFASGSTLAYTRQLSYVEIPIMTHVYFGNKTRFILNLGPQISFLVSDKVKANTDFLQNPPAGTQFGQIQHKFDYGLVGGLGMELNTKIGSFDVEGRYYFGLGDIFDNKREAGMQKFSRSAHRLIEAKLTYYLPL